MAEGLAGKCRLAMAIVAPVEISANWTTIPRLNVSHETRRCRSDLQATQSPTTSCGRLGKSGEKTKASYPRISLSFRARISPSPSSNSARPPSTSCRHRISALVFLAMAMA